MLRALRQGTVMGVVVAASACGSGHDSTGAGGTSATGAAGQQASGAPGTGGDGVAGSGGSQGGDAGAASGRPGTAGASGAGSGLGGNGGGSGGGGGRGGDASSGRAGDAGGSEAGASSESECAGPFRDERVIIAGAKNVILSSPTLPGDELEVFFVQRNPKAGEARRVFRAERSARDASFGEPAPVPELDTVCSEDEERSLSLTRDGLRLYIGCSTGVGMVAPGPLHLARRSDRDAPFVLDDSTYGTVGGGAAVAADELALYSSAERDVAGRAPAMAYPRSSLDEPFGEGHTIDGLDEVFLASPFLADDGLALFGGLSPDLVVTTRSTLDTPFGEPTVLFVGDSSAVVYTSAELSADCKTLYFLRADIVDGLPTYGINRASR